MSPPAPPRNYCGTMSVLLFIAGCEAPRIERILSPPPLAPLTVETTISNSATFWPSGAVGTEGCGILVVGQEWGSMMRINPDGSMDPRELRIPGNHRSSHLETRDGRRILVWSNNPPFLGIVTSVTAVLSLPVPTHPWGGKRVGPVSLPPSGRIAMAPLGGTSPHKRPDPWIRAPAIQIFDSVGGIEAIGEIQDVGGVYLPWLQSRMALGVIGDTVLSLSLSDGTLAAYASLDSTGGFTAVRVKKLRSYFRPPPVVEEVLNYPWIHFGGDQIKIVEARPIRAATFGPSGKIFMIRNYFAEWHPYRDKVFETDGDWEVKARGLEIYDPEGMFLGAWALPESALTLNWLRVGVNGRILFGDGEAVIVVQDPTSSSTPCPPMPPRITAARADRPSEVRAY